MTNSTDSIGNILTKREQFAMAALSSIANSNYPKESAQRAVIMADLLIAELNKPISQLNHD